MSNDIPPIAESLESLKTRLSTEPKARRKTRLQLLYLLKSGQATTREAVAPLLAVHRHTISRWVDPYARAGLAELLTLKTHPNRPPALPPQVKQALAQQLGRSEGFRTYTEAQAWLQEQWGVEVKYKTVHRIIRYELQAKVKVARPSQVKKTPRPAGASRPAAPRSESEPPRSSFRPPSRLSPCGASVKTKVAAACCRSRAAACPCAA